MAQLDDAAKQERRKKAGECLRMADKLFKNADYDGAARLVEQAIEVDPNNPYATAYRERIEYAIEKRDGKKPDQKAAAERPAPSAAKASPGIPVAADTVELTQGRDALAQAEERVAEAHRRALAEEARLHAIEEAKRKAEEEVRRKMQEEAHRKAEEEIRRRLEEANRKLEEERKKHEEEKLQREKVEEKRRREEEERRRAEEAERKKSEEAVRQRISQESQQELDKERRRIEQEAAKRLEEERKRIEKEMQERLQQERQRLEEQTKKEQETAQARRKAEELELRRLEEESKRKLDEERARLTAEKQRIEEEIRLQLEEERHKLADLRSKEEARIAEARRAAEEQARKQIEEEFRKRLEEEKNRLAGDQKRLYEAERARIEKEAREKAEEEDRRRIEEEQRQAEELKRKAEEEERRRQEEREAKRAREEEETRKYEEAVRLAIEEGRQLAQVKKIRSYLQKGKEYVENKQFEEALKEVTKAFLLNPTHEEARTFEQAIYAAREDYLKREEEAKRLLEEQRRKVAELQRKLEEQARLDREEHERLAIRAAKISGCLRKVDEYFREASFDMALSQIQTIYAMDPGNADAQDYEIRILAAQKRRDEAQAIVHQRSAEGAAWKREEEMKRRVADENRETLRRESTSTYVGILKQAWADGSPGDEERSMLEVVRRSLGVTEDVHDSLEREVRLGAYTEALRAARTAGITPGNEASTFENLRKIYSVSPEEHREIDATLTRGNR